MNATQAKEIAILLNKQNKLHVKCDADDILRTADQYCYLTDEQTGEVSAAVQTKRVQWYQHEVLHLSVAPAHVRKGLGKKLLDEAE